MLFFLLLCCVDVVDFNDREKLKISQFHLSNATGEYEWESKQDEI